jgi:hypothetical protein
MFCENLPAAEAKLTVVIIMLSVNLQLACFESVLGCRGLLFCIP